MNTIIIQTTINAPLATVWECWTNTIHVKNWNYAVADWHCPEAINNLTIGGEFHYTMAAKDNSMSFDFLGTYHNIVIEKYIDIVLGDGRKMNVSFEQMDTGTIVTEQFEPEQVNPIERQQAGWQMILDNFKNYVEQSI